MIPARRVLFLLVGISAASPLDKLNTRQTDDVIEQAIAAQTFPEYVAPSLNRDITDWLAIGDSFSAGVSADVPNDELNYQCSRFKKSYPNQMNENPRFPGFSTSRTFVFGACTGAKIPDLISKQIEPGTPDLKADHPKIGKPQIGTVSISGNDLGFADVRGPFILTLPVPLYLAVSFLISRRLIKRPDRERMPLSLGRIWSMSPPPPFFFLSFFLSPLITAPNAKMNRTAALF
jgi:hypothetical protein